MPARTRIRALSACLLILAFATVSFLSAQSNENERLRAQALARQRLGAELAELPLLAKAVSVYDAEDNTEIFGRISNASLPIASLAKTLTAIVFLETPDQGRIITISQNCLNQAGEYGFRAGEAWSSADLARFTLLASANDAACALAEGTPLFDLRAAELISAIGLKNFKLNNATGLDIDSAQAGAYGSASDSNKLALYALRNFPNMFSITVLPEINLESKSGQIYSVVNTNIDAMHIPNLFYSKTNLPKRDPLFIIVMCYFF